MIELLISQLIYERLTDIAYHRFRALMVNNTPHGNQKVIRSQEVTAILGNPNIREQTFTVTRCEWSEGSRSITVTFNNVIRDTISNWSASGF